MKKAKLNIDNLTDLWTIASSSHQGYYYDEQFEYAYIKNAQWPNRIWQKKPLSIQPLEKFQKALKKKY